MARLLLLWWCLVISICILSPNPLAISLFLSVNVFSMELLIGDTIFYVSNWRQDHCFTAVCGHLSYTMVQPFSQGKWSSFISQLFYDPEYWSGPGNQTHDLLFCSQALCWLSTSCRGWKSIGNLVYYCKKSIVWTKVINSYFALHTGPLKFFVTQFNYSKCSIMWTLKKLHNKNGNLLHNRHFLLTSPWNFM